MRAHCCTQSAAARAKDGPTSVAAVRKSFEALATAAATTMGDGGAFAVHHDAHRVLAQRLAAEIKEEQGKAEAVVGERAAKAVDAEVATLQAACTALIVADDRCVRALCAVVFGVTRNGAHGMRGKEEGEKREREIEIDR